MSRVTSARGLHPWLQAVAPPGLKSRAPGGGGQPVARGANPWLGFAALLICTSVAPALDAPRPPAAAYSGAPARQVLPGRPAARPRAAAFASAPDPVPGPHALLPPEVVAPVDARRDAFDLVVYARHRPLLIRVAVSHGGMPVGERWAGAVRKAFDHFDRDGNGFLNAHELGFAFSNATLAGLMTSGTFAPDPAGRPTIALVDRDGDRRVSPAELAGYYRSAAGQAVRGFTPVADNPVNLRATEGLFELFDADRDGRLTRAEMAAADRLVAPRDADEDECLDLSELLGLGAGFVAERENRRPAGGPPPEVVRTVGLYQARQVPGTVTQVLVKRYDRDGDGELAAAEVGLPADAFARLDADRDGKLSGEELDGWRTGPPDVEASLALGPTAAECRAEVTTPPAALAAGGFTGRREEARRLVVRHGRQAVELWAFAGSQSTAGTLKARFAPTFREAAGDKGYVALADLGTPQNQLVRVMFDPADRDADGKLTRAEFDRYLDLQQAFLDLSLGLTPAVQTPTLFQLLDENRDGKLGVRELRTAWDRLVVLEPVDGTAEVVTRAAIQPAVSVRLTRATDRAGPNQVAASDPNRVVVPSRGPVWFRKMDRNGDGDVSRGEFLGTTAEFDALDADHDGLVGLAEAEAFDMKARPAAVKDGGR